MHLLINLFFIEESHSNETLDKDNGDDLDELNSSLLTEAKKKRKNKTKQATPKTSQGIQEELISLQRHQMDLLKEQNNNNRLFMENMVEEQRKMEKDEREKDREFFLQLSQVMFSNNK